MEDLLARQYQIFHLTVCFFNPKHPFIYLYVLSRLRDIYAHVRESRAREPEWRNYYTLLTALKLYYECVAIYFFPLSNFLFIPNTRKPQEHFLSYIIFSFSLNENFFSLFLSLCKSILSVGRIFFINAWVKSAAASF